MEKDKNGKVVLCTDLLIERLLEEMLKNQVINLETYSKAVKVFKYYGTEKDLVG